MCSVDGCDRKTLARGLCGTHYTRWRKNGTTEKTRRRNTCSVAECEQPVRGNGLCSKHYARVRRQGSTETTRQLGTVRECARDGCSNSIVWQQSTQRKFCSTKCYQATPRSPYNYGNRVCEHCGSGYVPRGPMQRFCHSCIGPTVYSRGGHSRSLGLLRLRKYGVTHAQWVEMVARYGGVCWICRERPAAVLDHSHVTGRARGALCQGCNSQLGGVERDGWLAKAFGYLKEHE